MTERPARLVGIALGALHFAAVLRTTTLILSGVEPDWAMYWMLFFLIDMPASLAIYPFSIVLSLMPGFPLFQDTGLPLASFMNFQVPFLFFTVLGTLWWILVPLLVFRVVRFADRRQTPSRDRRIATAMEGPGEANVEHRLFAVVAGVGAAFVAAGLCAVLKTLVGSVIFGVPIFVGLAVGIAVRIFGRGSTQFFGVVGVGCSALGCFMAYGLTAIHFLALSEGAPIFETILGVNLHELVEVMRYQHPRGDLFAYVISGAVAYATSFRRFLGKAPERHLLATWRILSTPSDQ